ncbi:MAG TPA: Holliday junction resolvase RuvX [Dehalococcoidia bacterium]|nr:Holliday junction resolvase RuvX [Dehalococcoidia bacterium]
MRSLGLDIGDRRIGVALSDPQGILASPLTIIERQDELADIAAIVNIANQNQVGRIIVGLPLSMDGSFSEQTEKVRDFIQKLSEHTDIPVEFRDERLSTLAAQRLMRPLRKTGKKLRHDDAAAAALILQSYLDESQ